MRFEDLDVWRRAARLSAQLYRELGDLRDYGFRDQITRSGLSVASNIGEGYERRTTADRAKFIGYALGSAGELRTQLYIGIDAGFIEREQGLKWIEETRHLSRMLHALAATLRSRP